MAIADHAWKVMMVSQPPGTSAGFNIQNDSPRNKPISRAIKWIKRMVPTMIATFKPVLLLLNLNSLLLLNVPPNFCYDDGKDMHIKTNNVVNVNTILFVVDLKLTKTRNVS
jgi:hypothetical protein